MCQTVVKVSVNHILERAGAYRYVDLVDYANQIETLLKAAQILQQKKDQLMATSKQTTKTTILGHRRISENIDMEDSPYVSNTEDMVLDLVNKRPYDNKVCNFCRFFVYCVPFVKHLGSLSVTLFSLLK
jgi:hypothetical protein